MQGSNRAYGWRMTQAYPTQSAPPTPLPAGVLLTPKIIADKQHGQHGDREGRRVGRGVACAEGGRTPLHWACFHGKLEFVRELANVGADHDSKDDVS